jgi:hypothetical protein
MKRIVLLVTFALVACVVFSSAAVAQEKDMKYEETMEMHDQQGTDEQQEGMDEKKMENPQEHMIEEQTEHQSQMMPTTGGPKLDGPVVLLPAAALLVLLVSSGVLVSAVLRRR